MSNRDPFRRLVDEARTERRLGRKITPEERLAGQLYEAAGSHAADGHSEMAESIMSVANDLTDGLIDVYGAYRALGLSSTPES